MSVISSKSKITSKIKIKFFINSNNMAVGYF